ncbi:hypothetical protein BN1263300007 [Stenotrophomonas maltophilia]|nr:hypothetical protein BN1263300007 [Stenotrophomonas maltophilia]
MPRVSTRNSFDRLGKRQALG